MFMRYYGKMFMNVYISRVGIIYAQNFSSYLTEKSDCIRYEDRLVYGGNNSSFCESCEAAYVGKKCEVLCQAGGTYL